METAKTEDRALLIGDVGRVLVDAHDLGRDTFDVYERVVDGIYAAAQREYRTVYLVVCPATRALKEILCSLHLQPQSRVYLLTPILEEPFVRAMLKDRASEPGLSMIVDYLIGPIPASRLSQLSETNGREEPLPADAAVQQRIRQLEKLATEDDLTGLKNRRYMWEFAEQILASARRSQGRVTLLVYDIDDFKHYNDVYGHSTGDRILKEAAVLMRSCCRAHDVVGRIGGDEFAVIFWDDPVEKVQRRTDRRSSSGDHPREAISVAQRFRRALQHSDLDVLGPEGKGVLTISGGLASYPRDGDTVEQLFEKADTALLEAKRSGKNCVYIVGTPQGDIAEYEQA